MSAGHNEVLSDLMSGCERYVAPPHHINKCIAGKFAEFAEICGFHLKLLPDVEGEVLGGGKVGVGERQRLCRSNRGPFNCNNDNNNNTKIPSQMDLSLIHI